MKYKNVFNIIIVITLFSLSYLGIMEVQAGSKDMVAGKRTKFQDGSVASMRDVLARREAEEEAYRQKMLSNSDQTIALLTQVRDLLEQLNEKE